MDSRFFITVAFKSGSYEDVKQKFESLKKSSNQVKMAAAGIGESVAASTTQIKNAIVEANRLSRALRGAKPPGVPPYKKITDELKRAKNQAIALRQILTTPIPAHTGILKGLFKDLGATGRKFSTAPYYHPHRTTTYPHPGVFKDPEKRLLLPYKGYHYQQDWRRYGGALSGIQTGISRRIQQMPQHMRNAQLRYLLASGGYTSPNVQAQRYMSTWRDYGAFTPSGRAAGRPYQAFAETIGRTGELKKQRIEQYTKAWADYGKITQQVRKTTSGLGKDFDLFSNTARDAEFWSKKSGKAIKDLGYDSSFLSENWDKEAESVKKNKAEKRAAAVESANYRKNAAAEEESVQKLEKGVERYTKRLENYKKNLYQIRRGGSQGIITGDLLSERIDKAATGLLGVKTKEDFKKMRAEVKGIGKDFDQAAKKAKNFGNQGSFINSRFGKFSIIASGIAATLFIWQNLVHVIRSVVGVGVELETTFINLANKLELSTDQMGMLEARARQVGKAGFIKAPEFGEYVGQLTDLGFTLERATQMVETLAENQKDLFEDTVTGQLKEAAGLFKEIAALGYEFSEGPLIAGFSSLNTALRDITNANSGLEFQYQIWKKMGQAVTWASEQIHPFRRFIRYLKEDIAGLPSDWELLEKAIKRTAKATKDIDIGAGEEKYERIVSGQPLTSPLAQTAGREDFDAVNAVAEASYDFQENMKKGFKTIKEYEEFVKSISKELKAAAQFFGYMSVNFKKIELKKISDQISRLEKTELFSRQQLREYQTYLEKALSLRELQPGLSVHADYFKKLGVATKDYYKNMFDTIDRRAEESARKLRGYALATGGGLSNLPAPRPIGPQAGATTYRFEPVPAGYDFEADIEKWAHHYKVPEKFLKAIAKIESRDFHAYAVGPPIDPKYGGGHAVGPFQFIEKTARDLGINRLDVTQQAEAAARLMRENLEFHNQNLEKAVKRYYGGDERNWGTRTEKYWKDFQQALSSGDFEIKLSYAGGPVQTGKPYKGAEASLTQGAVLRELGAPSRLGEGFSAELTGELQTLIETHLSKLPAVLDQSKIKILESFNAYQSAIKPAQKTLRDFYNTTGSMHQAYFDNEVLLLDMQKELMLDQLKTLPGIEKAEAESLVNKIYNREKYLLTLQKIYSKELGISKDHLRALEEVFADTGYYAPELEKKQRLDTAFRIQRMMGNITGEIETGATDPLLATLPTQNEIKAAAILRAKDEIAIEEHKNKVMLESAQQYYDATGIMTDEHYNYRKVMIQLEDRLLQTMGATSQERQTIEDSKQKALDNERNKSRWNLHEQYFEVTNKMTEEYYNWQLSEIADMEGKMTKIVGEEMAERIALRKRHQVEVQRLLSEDAGGRRPIEAAARARTLQVEMEQKTMAEAHLDYLNQTVEGSQKIIEDQIFDVFQMEFDNLEDFFNSTGNAFKAMLDRMAADILAAGIAKLLFGELAAGIGGTGTGFGFGGGGTGILGAAAGWLATLFGGGAYSNPGAIGGIRLGPPGVPGMAKGGILSRSGIKKFATGGIVNSPMLFPYATGMGLMGEAGPEGVLPLTRTKSGELGVKNSDRQTIISPTIIVQAPEGKISKQSMNQLTNRLGKTLMTSTRRNS